MPPQKASVVLRAHRTFQQLRERGRVHGFQPLVWHVPVFHPGKSRPPLHDWPPLQCNVRNTSLCEVLRQPCRNTFAGRGVQAQRILESARGVLEQGAVNLTHKTDCRDNMIRAADMCHMACPLLQAHVRWAGFAWLVALVRALFTSF